MPWTPRPAARRSSPPAPTGPCGSPSPRGIGSAVSQRMARSRCFDVPDTRTPFGIAPGPDGALWFTEMNADRIGRDHGRRGRLGVPAPCRRRVSVGSRGTGRGFVVHPQPGRRDRADHAGRGHRSILCRPPVPPRSASHAAARPCGSSRSARDRSAGSRRTGDIRSSRFPTGRRDPTPSPQRPSATAGSPNGERRVGRSATGEIATTTCLTDSEPHGITVGPGGALWVALEVGGVARVAP